jgi:hypothetical protein
MGVLRGILGVIGLLALLIGLATVALMATAAATGAPLMQPLGQLWYTLHPDSLQLIQPLIERHLWAPIWQQAIFPVLEQPAPGVAAIGLLAAALAFLLVRVTKPKPRSRFRR